MALLPVADALHRILDGVKPLPAETIRSRKGTVGEFWRRHVKAKRDQPPFAASAMDGYAVRHADLTTLPATLHHYRHQCCGPQLSREWSSRARPSAFSRVRPCQRAPTQSSFRKIPSVKARSLRVIEPTPKGKNIRRAGLDFAKGDVLVEAGTKLFARAISDCSRPAMRPASKCYRRPRVVLFTTGDELVLPGQKPRADQIVSSNSHAIGRHGPAVWCARWSTSASSRTASRPQLPQ